MNFLYSWDMAQGPTDHIMVAIWMFCKT